MPVPTQRLALMAAGLSVAMLFVPLGLPWGLVAVNGALVTAALVDFWLATPPGVLGVEREAPSVLVMGAHGRVTWRVSNPTRRSLKVSLADALKPSLRADTRRANMMVPAGSATTVGTFVRPRRRGRFDLSAITVRVEGPIGLAARQQTLVRPAVLRVHPLYRSRDEAESRIRRSRLLEVGLRSAQGRGGGTDFDSLREYVIDDEYRRIDWAATARAGRAIVRTYRAERNQTIVCLLDCGRTMAAQIGGVPRLEHAMDAAMMMTHLATRLGDRAGLLAFGSQVRAVVLPRHGHHQLTRVTEAIYDLEPELAESEYRGAFTTALSRFHGRALLVLFTDLAEQAVTETLLPALPLVARSNVVILAGVTDPAVEGWASTPPHDASGAYRQAAAVAALDERRRVTARLRGMGVAVVDAAPGQMAPRLADVYLEVKAAGRL